MDQSFLLGLAVAVIVGLAAVGSILARPERSSATAGAGGGSGDPNDGPGFAVSTEGMKVCPKCGMGNLWTERTCSACGGHLKG